MPQNIYDNKKFFAGYQTLRKNNYSANNIEEWPNFYEMLPDLRGKRVLDLGCGNGGECQEFHRMGASYVLGIDISRNMIELAEAKNKQDGIAFRQMDMECLSELDEIFDVVTSSLAIHYVADFSKLAENVFSILDENGIFLFSQEHPIFTAPKRGTHWEVDINGNIKGMILEDYSVAGKRDVEWIVKHVEKYHRTFSDIINTLVSTGFAIEKLREPIIDKKYFKYNAGYSRTLHVPDYLFIKARKSK